MSATDDTPDNETDWTSKTLLASVALVSFIVLLAGWLLWPSSDSTAEQPESTVDGPPSTTTTEAPPAYGQRDGDCPEQPENDEIPVSGPETEWEVFHGAVLPTSVDHGPAIVEGDVARCYSHTPTGALIAASQFGPRSLISLDTRAVVEAGSVDGPGQAQLIEDMERTGPIEQVAPGDFCQTAGFRFISYTPDEAIMSVAAKCPGGFQLREVSTQWVDGDWKVVLDDSGSSVSSVSTINSLSDLTKWAGV